MGELGKAAELKYGKLPELEKRLAEYNKQAEKQKSRIGRMLKEEVGPEEIAEVVARWTGIPVNRMLEGEMEKLLHLEDRLRERVVGQDTALTVLGDAIRRARAEISDPNKPIGYVYFFRSDRCGQN